MKDEVDMLSDQQKRLLSEWLTGRKLGPPVNGDADKMPNRCTSAAALSAELTASWDSWGNNLANTRFQPGSAAGLSREAVPKLKLRWAFALPGAVSVYGQPAVVDGMLFVSADSGYVYALDARTGCVHWSFRAEAGVRTGPTIGPWPTAAGGYGVYFGDVHGTVYALDASSGRLHWKVGVDSQPFACLTGAIKLYEHRLYVPVTSVEEGQKMANRRYPCCTFRGSVVALDVATGRQIWKTYTISQVAQRRSPPSGLEDVPGWLDVPGTSYLGPAGAGVWNSPTIDPKQHALYFGTGNGYSGPATADSDAVFALDMGDGKILWSRQLLAGDFSPSGPDQDIAAGVILAELFDGRRLAVVAQKSMGVWAFDPDHDGALVWRQRSPQPNSKKFRAVRAGGEITFGGAADAENVYYAFGEGRLINRSGGLAALDLASGKRRWYTAVAPQNSMRNHPGFSAAISVIPGVIFAGGLDGTLRAFSTTDGSPLWSFDTTQKLETVNGVAGQGGSIGSAGPVIAAGWVFVTSGYVGVQNGVPGNLLLAFSASP
jgi:polyvinyl alcohol dehydrogenase (cytochrome)